VRTIAGVQALEINPTTLCQDFAGGLAKYLHDLRTASAMDQMAVSLNEVLKELFIRGD